MEQPLMASAAEDRRRQLEVAGPLAARREQRHLDRTVYLMSLVDSLFHQRAAPATACGLGAAWRSLAACLTTTSAASKPGTDPATRIALSSGRISITFRFTIVTFSLPI